MLAYFWEDAALHSTLLQLLRLYCARHAYSGGSPQGGGLDFCCTVAFAGVSAAAAVAAVAAVIAVAVAVVAAAVVAVSAAAVVAATVVAVLAVAAAVAVSMFVDVTRCRS
jgi:hypothetical protein